VTSAATLKGERIPFACLAFSPDGQMLAAGEAVSPLTLPGGARMDGAVRLWSLAAGKEVRQLRAGAGGVNAVAFSPDGRVVAAAGTDDGLIRLWDAGTGNELARLERTPDPTVPPGIVEGTKVLAFSPDGRTLAAVSAHKEKSNLPSWPARGRDLRAVSLWEIATGKMRYEMRLSPNSVRSIAFVGGRYLLLGCADGVIQVRDLALDEWLPVAHGHQDAVDALAVSPDGRSLVSGSWDTTALLWQTAALVGKKPLAKARPAARDIEKLLETLTGEDAPGAYRAAWELAGVPDCVPLLKARVRPVPVVDGARLKALIADLDGEEFAVREAATVELRRLGSAAAQPLREVLRGSPSPEVRRRAESLVAAQAPGGESERLSARALEVLEQMATPEAVGLLEALAQGAPAARQTKDARASLRRLGRP
jgi:hypothetical protein